MGCTSDDVARMLKDRVINVLGCNPGPFQDFAANTAVEEALFFFNMCILTVALSNTVVSCHDVC